MQQVKKRLLSLAEVLGVLILIMVIIPASWVLALFTVIVFTIATIKFTINKFMY